MSGGHVEALYREGSSPVHRLPPEAKLVAVAAFVVAVVAVPREQVWAFAVLAAAVTSVAAVARVPWRWLARRCLLGAPFLAVVPLLPLVAEGERLALGPIPVSRPGLWAAWNVAAKGVLGLASSMLLLATTRPADLVAGLDRLRVPPVFTTTAGFMVRYLHLTVDDARRMAQARLARGDDPRWLWQARGVAMTAGTLFVRTYERGERVHRAMLARGYTGRLPAVGGPAATGPQWLAAASLPAVGVVVAVTAWLAQGA